MRRRSRDRWLLALGGGCVLVFLVAPIIILIPLSLTSGQYLAFPPPGYSLQWYRRIFSAGQWVHPIWISVRVALATMVMGTALGVLTSLALVRGKFPWKKAAYALILAPIIVPGIITSIALYFFFAQVGLVGTLTGIAIGHTVLAMPIAVIILSATLQGFDQRLEQAAMSLGADAVTTFRRVTLPLIAPGVVSAAMFCFLISFDELLVPLFIAGPGKQTLPVQIWNSVLFGLEPTVAAVSVLLIGITVSVLVVVALMRRASMDVLVSRGRP